MEPESLLPHSHAPTTCPYPQPDQSIQCRHIPLPEYPLSYYTLIYALDLPHGLLPSDLPTKTLYALLLSPIRATSPANDILVGLINRIIFGEGYRSLSSSLCMSPLSSYAQIPPSAPYSRKPQPMLLPQFEWPSLSPMLNNRQYYSSVYSNINIFIANWKTKDTDRMIASNLWFLYFFMNGILIC